MHCHSVADSLCLKILVWAEYQLHGFHVIWLNWSSDLLRSGLTWNRRLWTKPLANGGNDSKPASGPKDNILNISYNFSRTCRLLVPTFFSILKPFSWSYNKKFQGRFFMKHSVVLTHRDEGLPGWVDLGGWLRTKIVYASGNSRTSKFRCWVVLLITYVLTTTCTLCRLKLN